MLGRLDTGRFIFASTTHSWEVFLSMYKRWNKYDYQTAVWFDDFVKVLKDIPPTMPASQFFTRIESQDNIRFYIEVGKPLLLNIVLMENAQVNYYNYIREGRPNRYTQVLTGLTCLRLHTYSGGTKPQSIQKTKTVTKQINFNKTRLWNGEDDNWR